MKTICRQRNGKLKGHYQTVEYLQRLGPAHIDLIFEFSKWFVCWLTTHFVVFKRLKAWLYRVLATDLEDGFAIFASDDYPEIATLPHVRRLLLVVVFFFSKKMAI